MEPDLIFDAPSHDSPERSRIASLLVRILLLLGGAFGLAGIAALGVEWVLPWQRVGMFMTAALMLGGVRLVQAKRERIVAWLLPLLLATSAVSSFANDAHDVTFLATFIVSFIIAGLVLDGRHALFFVAGCVLVLIGGVFAHQEGYVALARQPPGWGAYLTQIVLLSTAAVLMVWANRGIKNMVNELQQERAHLGELNRELTHTQARHEALLNHSFGGIVVVDRELKVTYCNSIAAGLLQLPEGFGNIPLSGIPGFDGVTFDSMRGDDGQEQQVHLGDGPNARPVGVRVGVTTLPNGEPGHLVLLRDLGELEASEQERDRLREQLQRSQKMEALGRLAAGLAHDFNNILTVVIGNSELLLLDGDLDADTEESVQMIRESCEKGSEVTRQLLTFGRQSSPTMENVDVARLVGDFLPMLSTMVHAKVDVRLEAIAEAVIRANPGELEQVLANLVINASAAMPKGGNITLRVERADKSVAITVTDTGEGMSEATRLRAFEPFFTTKEVGSGTGLGLSIVHGIVAAADGELHVRSQVGKGTTFEVRFPAIDGPPSPTTARDGERSVASLAGYSILVVDDEPNVLEAIRRMVAWAGATVTTATGGDEALRLFEAGQSFDAAVLDVLMPDMSGPSLAAKLREQGIMIPILFLSGHVPDAEKEGILESSPHFLSKPVSPAALSQVIASALADAARPAEGAPSNVDSVSRG